MRTIFYIKIVLLSFFLSILASVSCLYAGENDNAKNNEINQEDGEVLKKEEFMVRIKLDESKKDVYFKAFCYYKDKMIDPAQVKLNVEIIRLAGEKESFSFKKENDYLISDTFVPEPHSFDVKVKVKFENRDYEWTYPSYEGRTKIDDEVAKKSNIKTAIAQKGTINQYLRLTGRIAIRRDGSLQVGARFPGMVKKVYVNWGDQVKVGQLLVSIESNDSLKNYDVVSPINGTILNRNTNVGDVVGTLPLFTIADLSEVWGEFHVFPKELDKVKINQTVKVKTIENHLFDTSKISMLVPTTDAISQTVIAIVPLKNAEGKWRPGMIIEGDVLIHEKDSPIIVKSSAIQTLGDSKVIFQKVGNQYEAINVQVGDFDDEFVEINGDVKLGTEYVTDNSFIVKADIEKSGAAHDH